MLKTIFLRDNCNTQGCVLVLGGFDGVHIGHRRLIAHAKEQGVSVGVMTIVGGKGAALFMLEERLHIFKNCGVDFVIPFEFSEIRDKSAEEFLGELEKEFSPTLYVCGCDFRFGKDAKGDADTIKEVSKVPVVKEELVVSDGEKVATRHLKSLLEEGELSTMRNLMGDPYFIIGTVVRG